MINNKYDHIIIGGGFYGCSLALHLSQKGDSVLLLEKGTQLLGRASRNNQARVHGGYHYSRHFLTALRSRINLPKFIENFKNCIVDDIEMYYAISQQFSKTTAGQFSYYMTRAGAPLEKAPSKISKLFSPNMVTDVFKVHEPAFNAEILKKQIEETLHQSKVQVVLKASVQKIVVGEIVKDPLSIIWTHENKEHSTQATNIYNCTYSDINSLLKKSNLTPIPLYHELTELCEVEVPEEIKKIGFTIMCGPFFSVMPFPIKNNHTLSHVRYTPHTSWRSDLESSRDNLLTSPPTTHFPHMIRDASKYLPLLKSAKHISSIWEIKTLLTGSDKNDSRPILCKNITEAPGLKCIMGGKIDNIYDVFNTLD